jgi:hypothetical protein
MNATVQTSAISVTEVAYSAEVLKSCQSSSGRQTTNRLTRLAVSDSEIMLRLEVQPKLRINPKPVSKAQRRVPSDRALAGN